LPPNGPPSGYGWEERDMSLLSTTTAFGTGIDERDKFFGERRCVICGVGGLVLQYCHIIREAEPEWSDLKDRGWVPSEAKNHPGHESRDGLLMCPSHHVWFDGYEFFIRYFPDIRKFVFVNFSGSRHLQPFHGKAIALDIRDRHAPFPSLFIIHEMRVRGFHPFSPVAPEVDDGNLWQDWILSDGVFDNALGSFNRDGPPPSGNNDVYKQPLLGFQPPTTGAGGPSSGRRTVALNEDVIADILAATHAMPSWKACQMEGTSWAGTAEENVQKY
ncbi:hypothetical protein FISHEDRAFT_23499, partial [Fistulina hepatica ATCC 64428]